MFNYYIGYYFVRKEIYTRWFCIDIKKWKVVKIWNNMFIVGYGLSWYLSEQVCKLVM